jgi:tetratricopeptide (TPR) repeat protein
MTANMARSRLLFERGDTDEALKAASAATEIGQQLVSLDPNNADWKGRSANTEIFRGSLLLRVGKAQEASNQIAQGCGMADQLVARDPSVTSWTESVEMCRGLRAELAAASGDGLFAREIAQSNLASVLAKADPSRSPFDVALAHKLVGDIAWRTGDRPRAIAAWKAGLAAWPRNVVETARQMVQRAEMLRGTGAREEAARISTKLAAKGYRQSISNVAKV